MLYRQILEHVLDRTGLTRIEDAKTVTLATTRVLGRHLTKTDVLRIASFLPEPLHHPFGLEAEMSVHHDDERFFFDEVAHLAELPLEQAAEQAQVVCETLAEFLEPDAVSLFRVRLPSVLATLFSFRSSRPPAHYTRPPAERETLASGRPGSRRPISEAKEPAHSDSVARSDDPHAATKLSSSEGLTQERLKKSLAEGRPEGE